MVTRWHLRCSRNRPRSESKSSVHASVCLCGVNGEKLWGKWSSSCRKESLKIPGNREIPEKLPKSAFMYSKNKLLKFPAVLYMSSNLTLQIICNQIMFDFYATKWQIYVFSLLKMSFSVANNRKLGNKHWRTSYIFVIYLTLYNQWESGLFAISLVGSLNNSKPTVPTVVHFIGPMVHRITHVYIHTVVNAPGFTCKWI